MPRSLIFIAVFSGFMFSPCQDKVEAQNRISSFGKVQFIGSSKGGSDEKTVRVSGRVPTRVTPTGLLSGFRFEYNNKDHHISQISARASTERSSPNVTANVFFEDKNGDDNFKWQGSFVAIDPGNQVVPGRTRGRFRGTTTVRLQRPSSQHIFVLRGFLFSFGRGKDHHIDRIAIREVRGDLVVDFSDKNGDDEVVFAVEYAYVHPSAVARTQKFVKRKAFFEDTRIAQNVTANSVISGFEFDFGGKSDKHLKAFGAEIIGNQIRASYFDKHKRGAYSYCIEVATLRTNPR